VSTPLNFLPFATRWSGTVGVGIGNRIIYVPTPYAHTRAQYIIYYYYNGVTWTYRLVIACTITHTIIGERSRVRFAVCENYIHVARKFGNRRASTRYACEKYEEE